jgi:hypothetical protein
MKFKLLSAGSNNAKLAKDSTKGVLNYILSLAPYKLNDKGINLCPKASEACISSCINTAGHGQFNSVQEARKRKSNWLLSDREGFLNQLWNELVYIDKYAGKRFKLAAVRLNGFSDLDFPKLFTIIGKDLFSLENCRFYDYTKVITRLNKYPESNYYLTFSRSEKNSSDCLTALELGVNVAVVFHPYVPESWNGLPVYFGDDSDLRFNDPKRDGGYIIGLKAKGKGKKDLSGFVVRL